MTNLNVMLASSLFDLEDEEGRSQATFRTGVDGVDDVIRLWNGGRVLGVGRVEGKKDNSSTAGTDSLLTNLITTHLFDLGQQTSAFFRPDWSLHPQDTDQQDQTPSVFIIAPPKSSTVSDGYNVLLAGIQKSQSAHRKTRPGRETTEMVEAEDIALRVLEEVNLLQYLDLTGLAESISEVGSLVNSRKSTTTKTTKKPFTKAMVVIEGLDSAMARALSRSSSVLLRTAALLTGIFRSLRQLVRSNPGVMVLVELEVGVELARTDGKGRGEGLKSAFADGKGRTLRIGGLSRGSAVGRRVVGADNASGGVGVVLERIVESALDGIVVVHDGFKDSGGVSEAGSLIVEVMKDAMDDGLGTWAVWRGT